MAWGGGDLDILWIDFGYNFGGSQFIDASQFCIQLMPDESLDSNKINLFSLGEIDSATLAHILCNGTSHFLAGGVLYGTSKAWREFNALMRLALRAFVSFNILDDDQKLYLWVVRNYPSKCNVLPIDGWFNALFYFIPNELRQGMRVNEKSILQKARLNAANLSYVVANPPFKMPLNPENKPQKKSFKAKIKEVKTTFKAFRRAIKALFRK